MTKRLYNMDLARVLLIFMVIVLHFNNRDMGGALNTMSIGVAHEIFTRLTQSLSICAVDCFIILSGYLTAWKTKNDLILPWRKALWLLAACSFYRTVGYLLYVLWITHDFSLRILIGYLIPNNWFVCLFVTLLLLTPYINCVLERFGHIGSYDCSDASDASSLCVSGDKGDGLGVMVGIMTVLFSVVPTIVSFAADFEGVNIQGLSTVTWQGDGSGFNIMLFIYCYCLGYTLYKHRDYWDRFSPWFYFGMYVVTACLTAALSRFTESVWNYSCVTVVLEAVMFTLIFTRLRVGHERIGRALSAIGGCSLGIFVWHTMPIMIYGLWSRFDIVGNVDGMAGAAQNAVQAQTAYGFGHTVTTFITATLAMYVLSFVWVYACRTIKRILCKGV